MHTLLNAIILTLLIQLMSYSNTLAKEQWVEGSDDPSSMRYLGTSIQTGTYNRQTDVWRNINRGSTISNFSKQERVIYRAFNFTNWDK